MADTRILSRIWLAMEWKIRISRLAALADGQGSQNLR
jgi:hypothetical protein